MKTKNTYIILFSMVLVAFMVWNILTEPGITDLQGNFKEVSFIRNEQNSGPVNRIYAVTVNGDYWKEMEQYGNYMPHTKYGITRIYFFSNKKQYPTKLILSDNNIGDSFKEYCIGIYEKNGMSQVSLRKYPFIN